MSKKNKVILVAFVVVCVVLCVIFQQKKSENKREETNYTLNLEKEKIDSFKSIYYGGDNDIVFEDPNEVVSFLDAQGECNAVTIPIAWSMVEPVDDQYSYDKYKLVLEKITEAGYDLIIVIDAGGRSILKDGEIVSYSIPDWLWEKYPQAESIDFEGNKTGSFDYFSTEGIEEIRNFYSNTIEWLLDNYKSDIVGIAPGIMGEGEIKYAQTGFRWQSYSNAANKKFQAFLCKKYGSIERLNKKMETNYSSFFEIEMPIINYNNTVTSINTEENRLFTEMMICRENQIKEFVSKLVELIHEKKQIAIGYFGQFMFPLDAIYATGVVSKCSDLFDAAVIDYNFFDGYKEVYDADIPAYLTNLVSNLGYKKVYTGLYFERVSLDGKSDFIKELSDNIVIDGHSDGLEIGSLANNTEDNISFTSTTKKNKEKSKIAIYTSEWNFYKTHGENEEYQSYLSDSVVKLYHILQFELGVPVEVISDYNIESDQLNNFDIVFLPCQIFVPETSVKEFENYIKNGGKLIQDFRFGEYDNYGKSMAKKANEIFGIEELKMQEGNSILIDNKTNCYYGIKSIGKGIPSSCSYRTKDNSKKLFLTLDLRKVGVKTKNTVTWGFQPQIQYQKKNDDKYINLINDSIIYLQ